MIRIFPDLWDKHMHAEHGAPTHREAALALVESGYKVVVYDKLKRLSDTAVAVAFDTSEEGVAISWLLPGVDDDGPMQ